MNQTPPGTPRGPSLSMGNLGTPMNRNLIDPFNTSLYNLLVYCRELLNFISRKRYQRYAFSGSFAIYLYKQFLHCNGNHELPLDNWKPQDIDILVDKNISQLMSEEGIQSPNPIKQVNFSKSLYGNNLIFNPSTQIVSFYMTINGYERKHIEIIPQSARLGNLNLQTTLVFNVNNTRFEIPVLTIEEIRRTKDIQIIKLEEKTGNSREPNKINRVQRHIGNLDVIEQRNRRLFNSPCGNQVNTNTPMRNTNRNNSNNNINRNNQGQNQGTILTYE
jgi:hypothetical protein